MDWKDFSIKKSAKKGRRAGNQQTISSTSSSNAPSSLQLTERDDSLSIDLDVSIDEQQPISPPKKITAGWADSGSKSAKNKNKNSFDDDKFITTLNAKDTDDEIPIIPDLDDIQDDLLMNEVVEPPSVTINRVVTLKELDSDLLKQSAFATLEDVDLSILTKHLEPQDSINEPDEVWDWDQVFTQISAEIHSETSASTKSHKMDSHEEVITTQYLS